MSAPKPEILIIGAGLGGLFLGCIFEKMQVSYRIFERASEIKPLGAAIGFGANILPVFNQLGLMDEVEKISLVGKNLDMYNTKGDFIGGWDLAYQKKTTGYDQLVFARQDIHALLLSKIPPEKILMNKKVVSSEQDNQRVTIVCADDSTYHGDILVGADGAYSSIRKNLYKDLASKNKLPTSDTEDLLHGHICLLGTTEAVDIEKFPVLKESSTAFRRTLPDGGSYTWTIITVPGQRVCWNVIEQLSEQTSAHKSFQNSEWGPEANEKMIAEIRDFESPIGGTLGDLIDVSKPETISRVFLEHKLFETWYDRRIVLLGDAAHKFLPSGGQGACNAMQDAVILANCIYDLPSLNTEDINAAFEDYREQRYPHAKSQIERADFLGKVMFGQTFSEKVIRHFLFNWVPKSIQTTQFHKNNNYRPQLTFLPMEKGLGPILPQKPSRRYAEEQAKNGTHI
ncbi:hypothetical protein BGX26_008863 [Mortierella sp. AD094]|nr:hypothetical protein BGX26_008863 [Mortierella sp. AD094]